MSRGVRAGLAGVALTGALTATAHAGLLPAETIGTPLRSALPTPVIHEPGDQLTLAWIEGTGSSDETGVLRERSAGSAFGPLVPLGGQLTGGAVASASGAVAISADGTNFSTPTVLLRAAPGADFISLPIGTSGVASSQPVAGIDAAGDVLAAFLEKPAAHTRVAIADRPAGGSFSAPLDLSPGGFDADVPHLAMNPAGDAVVAWSRGDGAGNRVIQAAVRPAGGAFSAPKTLATDPVISGTNPQPSVAIDAGGRIAVAVQHADGGHFRIVMLRGTAATGLGGVETVATPGDTDSLEPSVTYADDHTLLVAYRQYPLNLQVSRAVDGGSFGAPELVSSSGAQPALYGDGKGHVALAFPTADLVTAKYTGLDLAYRPPGGPFHAPDVVDTFTAPVQPFVLYIGINNARAMPVTFDHAGDPLIGWTRDDTKGNDDFGDDDVTAMIRMDDVIAPAITELSVPATAAIGRPVPFSAGATDAASAVSYHWDFGDGSGADGPAVSHAFGTAGARSVTLTATDGGGNSTTATGAVTVPAAPVVPVTPPVVPVAVRCHVPTLTGHTEAYARKALTKGHCKLGTVRRPAKRSQRHSSRLRVRSQTVKHGTYRTKDTKVGITLAIPRTKKRKKAT